MSVVRCCFPLKSAGVAVRVAVQANAVQQCVLFLGKSTICVGQFFMSFLDPRARKCFHMRCVQSAFHWSPVSRLPLRLHAWEEGFRTFCMISVLGCQNISQIFATPQNRCIFNLYPPAFGIYPYLLLLHENGTNSQPSSLKDSPSIP